MIFQVFDCEKRPDRVATVSAVLSVLHNPKMSDNLCNNNLESGSKSLILAVLDTCSIIGATKFLRSFIAEGIQTFKLSQSLLLTSNVFSCIYAT